MKKASVVDMKNRLSAYLDEVAGGAGPVVITKRGIPVAALVSMADFETINRDRAQQGLAAVAGRWKGFEEIEKDVMRAFASRSRNSGRKVIG